MKVHNGAATGLAALQQSASDIKQDCDELQGSLSVTLDRFDAVQKDADDIESDVTDNVSSRASAQLIIVIKRLTHKNTLLLDCGLQLETPSLVPHPVRHCF